MTEDSTKGKLTLSGKTLTLKKSNKSLAGDGKKVVQVEVRKKRIVSPSTKSESKKVEIDEETAQKLKLIAEAKEHDAKRKKEEEEKAARRQQRKKDQILIEKQNLEKNSLIDVKEEKGDSLEENVDK